MPVNSRKKEFAIMMNEFVRSLPPDERLHLEKGGSNSLAAWFLGPKAENRDLFKQLIEQAIEANCNDRLRYFKNDPIYVTDERQGKEYTKTIIKLRDEFNKLLFNLSGSVPFFSYRYQAHMNWDLTIPGMIGYFSAMLYNQNNVSAEASPVTSQLEALVGDDLCKMIGYDIPKPDSDEIRPWGHITCDGSVANLEAMWAARNLKYYPISLAAALKKMPTLSTAKDITVKLYTGEQEKLTGLDTWTLLNLNIDEILALPNRIIKILDKNGVKDASNVLNAALTPYLIQSMGLIDFNNKYLQGIPQPLLMGPATKHYSWPKNASVLGIGNSNFRDIAVDMDARMDKDDLRAKLDLCIDPFNRTPLIMVVVVLGSTEQSAVDPLAEIIKIRDEHRKKGLEFIIHVDAAWGGYFASILKEPLVGWTAVDEDIPEQSTPILTLSDYVAAQYNALGRSDSVTIDPHKAGYIPYPAGGLCYRNSSMRNLVAFLAPEVYHGGKIDASVGVFGIEGSKPGAAAAGVYLSHCVIRPDKSGYGKILGKALFNSKRFFSAIITMAHSDDPFIVKPVQQIPAERAGESEEKIAQQMEFIKTRIVPPQNYELQHDLDAMELLKQLGSDLTIITYAFNFKIKNESGAYVLNTDPKKMNDFNQAIFKRLSLTPDSDKTMETPLIITTSTFEHETYGKEFVRTFMKRMGVNADKLLTMNFISSTTMCPWLTATKNGNFIPELIRVFKDTIMDVVNEFQNAEETALEMSV